MSYKKVISFLVFAFAAFPAWAGVKIYDIEILLYQPHPWAHHERPSSAQGVGRSVVSEKSQGVTTGDAAGQDWARRSSPGTTYMLGIEVAAIPDYEGSDEYTGAIGPILRYKFSRQRYFALLGNKAYLNILNRKSWEFGPMAVYRRGRDNGDIDDPVVKLMSDVDDSLELGAFLSYREIYNSDPRHRMKITLAASQDVSDGHDGLVASLSGVYWTPVSRLFDIGLRGGVQYASDNYMSSFFSVNAADSLASGLSTFDANEGIKDVSLAVMTAAHLNRHWQIRGRLSYKILVGDASDSPVVAVRGEDGQFSAGVSVLYSW